MSLCIRPAFWFSWEGCLSAQMVVRLLRLFLLACAAPLATSTALVVPVSAQTTPASVAPFAAAMQRGDAAALRAVLAERVLVSIEGDSRVYSREQAVHVLDRFFKDHPADGFSVDYPREMGGDAVFAAGRYRSDGETYVVRVLLGPRNGRHEAREVRIDQGRLE